MVLSAKQKAALAKGRKKRAESLVKKQKRKAPAKRKVTARKAPTKRKSQAKRKVNPSKSQFFVIYAVEIKTGKIVGYYDGNDFNGKTQNEAALFPSLAWAREIAIKLDKKIKHGYAVGYERKK